MINNEGAGLKIFWKTFCTYNLIEKIVKYFLLLVIIHLLVFNLIDQRIK